MPVPGTGFGGFQAPAKPTFAPFTIAPGAGQIDLNAAAQQQFEANNPGIYGNQSSGLSAGSNLTGGFGPEYSIDFSGGLAQRGDSVTMAPASPFFGGSGAPQFGAGSGGFTPFGQDLPGVQAPPGGSQFNIPDESGTGLFTQNPDGSFSPAPDPGGSGGQQLPPDTAGGGGGGQQAFDPGGGGQQASPGQDTGGGGQESGGTGGAGGMGGMPIDIQALGPGTTQPIQGWVDEAIKAGTGWVQSAEGVATNAIKAGQTFGSVLFGGVTNWFVRGFLIVLGALLVIVGLIVLMWDHGGEQVAVKAAKAVAA